MNLAEWQTPRMGYVPAAFRRVNRYALRRPEHRDMPPAPKLTRLQRRALEKVKEASDARAEALARADDAAVKFRRRIIAAAAIGCSLDQIATVAGVSKTRVHQIIRSE